MLEAPPPTDPDTLLDKARLYQARGTDPSAQLAFAWRAVQARPENAEAHKLFALACRAHGLEPLAIGHLRRCLALAPEDANAAFHLGLTLLQFGHTREGWQVYERRPTMPTANGYVKPAPPGRIEWQGQDLAGKCLVLLGEDGHGDQIQNVRFARHLLALRPRRLVLDVRPALRRLFLHSLRGEVRVSAATLGEVGDDADYVLAFGSLAARFAEHGPGGLPYLWPMAPPVARPPRPLRIGLVWRGMPHLNTDQLRSIPLGAFTPLLSLAGAIQWVSLQHDDHRADEAAILRAHRIETPLRRDFDFLDTAGVIAGLDLVIAVDTAIAHLAGALGRPVWLLNRATGEWRWGWQASTTAWYPTMRIFNQERLLDWAPVLHDVAQALAAERRDTKE